MVVATQLKVGNVILHNGKPYRVSSVLHVTPGNWRGMVQTRLVDLVSGNGTEHRFRSEDKVDLADMETHRLKFMYRAGDAYLDRLTTNSGRAVGKFKLRRGAAEQGLDGTLEQGRRVVIDPAYSLVAIDQHHAYSERL